MRKGCGLGPVGSVAGMRAFRGAGKGGCLHPAVKETVVGGGELGNQKAWASPSFEGLSGPGQASHPHPKQQRHLSMRDSPRPLPHSPWCTWREVSQLYNKSMFTFKGHLMC